MMAFTVISFMVRVPVLSEQTTVIAPRVSTVGSLRMMARLRAIACTPSERMMEIIAGRPSGTEATARLIRESSSSPIGISRNTRLKTNSAAIIARMMAKIALPSLSICTSSGVRCFSMPAIIWLMWPSSVSWPVAMTTPTPPPALTVVPEKTRFVRSPSGNSPFSGFVCLSTTVDSPVRIASSTRKLCASIKRISAGIRSPARNTIISPGTISVVGIVSWLPLRITRASLESILRILFRDFSALLS